MIQDNSIELKDLLNELDRLNKYTEKSSILSILKVSFTFNFRI